MTLFLKPAPRETAFRLLRDRRQAALAVSNTLAGLGGGMQVLLLGWLVIAWGHSPWYLAAFALTRFAPKIALTVPAGVACDRFSRSSVLLASRRLKVVASALPLMGFVSPYPVAWLLAASLLSAVIIAFEVPASRGLIGDITAREDLNAAVTLNGLGGQISSLFGPAFAYVLAAGPGHPTALVVSAGLLAVSAMAASGLTCEASDEVASGGKRANAGGLLEYLASAPLVGLLLVAGLAPSITDKAVAMGLPSFSSAGAGAISVALIAPELGGLLAAGVLAITPVRATSQALIMAAIAYPLSIFAAIHYAGHAEMLIVAMAFAGIARLVFSVSALARVQHLVPAEMRGRAFAI